MGTRGAYGFYKNGIHKITYNHWDSYPDGLGDKIAKFLKTTTIKQMNQIFDKIILVDEHKSTPTKKQIETYKKFADIGISNQSYDDWYCLLAGTRQHLEVYKEEGIVHMIDSWEFLKDSLYCEWAYIINLDENILEVCGGFIRKAKDQHPRYHQTKKEASAKYDEWEKNDSHANEMRKKPYYSIGLLYTFPLNAICKGRDPFYIQKLLKERYSDD